jgi:hypothetical protein
LTWACSEPEELQSYLVIIEPEDGVEVSDEEVTIRGKTEPNAKISRNKRLARDDRITANPDGDWEYTTKLRNGKNDFEFYVDSAPKTRARLTVTFQRAASGTAGPTVPPPQSEPTGQPSPTHTNTPLAATPTPLPSATRAAPQATPTSTVCDSFTSQRVRDWCRAPSGDVLNCSDFSTRTEASRSTKTVDPADINGLDADRDRVSCESLPP